MQGGRRLARGRKTLTPENRRASLCASREPPMHRSIIAPLGSAASARSLPARGRTGIRAMSPIFGWARRGRAGKPAQRGRPCRPRRRRLRKNHPCVSCRAKRGIGIGWFAGWSMQMLRFAQHDSAVFSQRLFHNGCEGVKRPTSRVIPSEARNLHLLVFKEKNVDASLRSA